MLKPTVADCGTQTSASYVPWNSQKHFSAITQKVVPNSRQPGGGVSWACLSSVLKGKDLTASLSVSQMCTYRLRIHRNGKVSTEGKTIVQAQGNRGLGETPVNATLFKLPFLFPVGEPWARKLTFWNARVSHLPKGDRNTCLKRLLWKWNEGTARTYFTWEALVPSKSWWTIRLTVLIAALLLQEGLEFFTYLRHLKLISTRKHNSIIWSHLGKK